MAARDIAAWRRRLSRAATAEAATMTEFVVTKTSSVHPALATYARAIHRLAESEAESIVEYILETGRFLHEARRHVTHETWVTWIVDEFGWNPVTAFRFVRAYTEALEHPISARNARGEHVRQAGPSRM
jgi:hypothetical protein